MKVLGLMSGTSLDGIDAALCEIEGSGENLRAKVLAFECAPYSPELRLRLLKAAQNEADVREVARLNVEVGRAFGAAAQSVFERYGRADLIGSHGQTICHLPEEGASFQIGEAAIISQVCECDVVSDFRVGDLAVGGAGAPLVPYVDFCLFRSESKHRVLLNIGGISNCTILAAGANLESVRAWDCGPGNMPLDAATQHFFGQPYDFNGELSGAITPVLQAVTRALGHPFFARLPPKTAGREDFGHEFFDQFLQHNPTLDGFEVLASLIQVTSRAIAQSILENSGFEDSCELIVSGGGRHNPTLMQSLQKQMPNAVFVNVENFGVSPDAKEALAFAILAHETVNGVPTNVPGATGARKRAILGKITRFFTD